MEDQAPIYMLIIVGIVAVVGIGIMLMNSGAGGNTVSTAAQTTDNTGNSVTGDITASDFVPALTFNALGKVFFVVFLLGVFAYMYVKME